MNTKKYYWELNASALKGIKKILKNPDNIKYLDRIYTLLSRCDKPVELFSLISKQQFIESWPSIRKYWSKKGQSPDFKAWWETIYEQLLEKQKSAKGLKGKPPQVFAAIGLLLKNKRLDKGLSQSDLARQAGMKQPDISEIEMGSKNITLATLLRLCKILQINNLPL